MPTGYTADVGTRDVTFNEFVWTCARAFGALITMRDEPSDAPIPSEFKPSSHHHDALEKAKIELDNAMSMSLARAKEEASRCYEQQIKDREDTIDKKNKLREKYEAMYKKVFAWVPPSEEHVGLRNFMFEQLKSSIDFDCGDFDIDVPVKLSASTYKRKLIAAAKWSVKYHEKGLRDEIENCRSRTAWVKALRDSVGNPPRMK